MNTSLQGIKAERYGTSSGYSQYSQYGYYGYHGYYGQYGGSDSSYREVPVVTSVTVLGAPVTVFTSCPVDHREEAVAEAEVVVNVDRGRAGTCRASINTHTDISNRDEK